MAEIKDPKIERDQEYEREKEELLQDIRNFVGRMRNTSDLIEKNQREGTLRIEKLDTVEKIREARKDIHEAQTMIARSFDDISRNPSRLG